MESPKFWILSGSRVRREPNYKTRNKLTTLFSNRHIKCLKCSTRCGFQDSSQDLIESVGTRSSFSFFHVHGVMGHKLTHSLSLYTHTRARARVREFYTLMGIDVVKWVSS